MIRRTIYVSVVFLCFGMANLWGQIKHQVSFSAEYSITEVESEDGSIYSRVNMPGLYETDSVGYPALPVKYIKLIIPSYAKATGVMIDKAEGKKLSLSNLIEPVQKPVPIKIGYEDPGYKEIDKARYGSNIPYPVAVAEIAEQSNFQGNQIVTLAIYPFQYFPNKSELFYYPDIDFTLLYKNGEQNKVRTISNAKSKEQYYRILTDMIDNKEDINNFDALHSWEKSTIKETSGTLTPKSTGPISWISCDYIIITSADLAPAFNEFIAWKKRKGLDVRLVTTSQIYSEYTGDLISGIYDNAGKIRQFLFDMYNNGMTYALLGGDYNVLPIRYGYDYCDVCPTWKCQYVEDSIHYIIPNDLYFSEFNGDWETDNDGRYGEPCDNVDFYPEIYIGRVLVTNADEVKNWTKKMLTYETNPGNGDHAYLTKAFFTQADELQRDDQASYVLNKCSWITNDLLYEEEGGYNTTTTPNFPKGNDIMTEFNNHYGLCSFMGHGGPNNVAVATPYKNQCLDIGKYKLASNDSYSTYCEITENSNGLDKMTNADYPTINYSISCDNMPFDDYHTEVGQRNFGESYTGISGGGGPAFIGNTRYGWVSSSYILFGYFVDIIAAGTSFNIGIAEATSKQATSDRYLRFSHNLLGCPETEIWTASPSSFSNAYVSESGSTVYVNAGTSNSTICVMSALDNGSSYHETELGVSSKYFYNVPSPYLVTITKHDFLPYQKNPDNVYIQDEIYGGDDYIYGVNFYAGESVTTSIPEGPVVVQNGAQLIFDASGTVNLEGGFEVQLGGEFEIK